MRTTEYILHTKIPGAEYSVLYENSWLYTTYQNTRRWIQYNIWQQLNIYHIPKTRRWYSVLYDNNWIYTNNPINMTHPPHFGLMLVHHLRWRPSIKPTLESNYRVCWGCSMEVCDMNYFYIQSCLAFHYITLKTNTIAWPSGSRIVCFQGYSRQYYKMHQLVQYVGIRPR